MVFIGENTSMAFLDDNYLLPDVHAAAIYDEIRALPLLDAHNHCDVQALADNRNFADLWEAEASTDHYVWELLRKCGVPEDCITGGRSNREKFAKMAEVFPYLAGNPTYEWIHLDLRRRLGIELELDAGSAEEIWRRSGEALSRPESRPQSLLEAMNVEVMCSTDDPADTLEHHRILASKNLPYKVFPTFRPDKAMNIAAPAWNAYLDRLGQRWGQDIRTLSQLLDVLARAHSFFADAGCRASDHGVNVPWTMAIDRQKAESVFGKARAGQPLDPSEAIAFMAFFLNEMAALDAERGWVFQLHIGAVRDVRKSLFDTLGPDSGGDLGDHLTDYVTPLLPLLNRFDGRLQIVLYNMNPAHNATLAQLTRAFGRTTSLGLAWWLNDSYAGMRQQLECAASVDLLSAMSGMVSDSRKILSYGSRFEVFRRTLSAVLGAMVGRGQMSRATAVRLARRLSYERPKELYGF